RVQNPLLRGPARLAEALALLPQVTTQLPAATLPLENPRALASMLGAAAFIRGLRESGVRPLARELLAAVATVAPAVLAVRGGELAAYHGAEHISIGSYEHGKRATREHERCGGRARGCSTSPAARAAWRCGRLAPARMSSASTSRPTSWRRLAARRAPRASRSSSTRATASSFRTPMRRSTRSCLPSAQSSRPTTSAPRPS